MTRKILQFAPYVGDEEYAAIRDCFDANWLTEGPKSREFVDALKALMAVKHASLAPNGTLSIYLALRAVGVGPGDDVVVPSFTFFGSASAVQMCGATPVFCDIDPETLQASAKHFAASLTPRAKAIMPVHIYGMCCDMDPIMALAKSRGLLVVEDAAQAVGVHYGGRHAGTFGNVGSFSFFADKTITTGEGGLVVTNDDAVAESLLYLRNQGRLDRGSFVHPHIGYNFRLTDLQAAVGLVQLSKLGEITRIKLANMEAYRTLLDDIPQVRFLQVTPGSTYIPFRVAIYAERAMELMRFMDARNIQTRTFFYPLHRQPAFQYLRDDPERADAMDDRHFPGAIFVYENGVCLPSYPGLPREDLQFVCETIRQFYARQ
jgi:perosamine synthetase